MCGGTSVIMMSDTERAWSGRRYEENVGKVWAKEVNNERPFRTIQAPCKINYHGEPSNDGVVGVGESNQERVRSLLPIMAMEALFCHNGTPVS